MAIKRFVFAASVGIVAFFIFLFALMPNGNQAKAEQKIIVAFGDSLSAGYQLPPEDSFPSQLQAYLVEEGYNVRVINAGVSGDTTTGGKSRLEWVMQDLPNGHADLVILELGGNDVLRGIDPAISRQNLDSMLTTFRARNIPVLLAGMQAPRNLGRGYADQFNAIYPELAEKHDVELYPFFLEGVVLRPHLNLSDGMHPNAKGIAEIVDNIAPYVESFLE